jgi:two-component sensor histidine kinase
MLSSIASKAQECVQSRTDSLVERLLALPNGSHRISVLLQLSTLFLNNTLDPKKYLDHVQALVDEAEALCHRLGDNKGREDALFLKAKVLIKKQNTNTVLRMLTSLSDSSRIKILLELGKDHLHARYTRPANPEGAIHYFQQAATLCDGTRYQKWKEESWCLMGIAYLLKGDRRSGKAYFMQAISEIQKAGNKRDEMKAWLRMETTTFSDEYKENLFFLSQALALSRQLDDKEQEALILIETGYKHLNAGHTREAQEYAQQALAIQGKIGSAALNQAYHELANESVYYTPSDYGYLSNAYYFLSDLSQVKGDLNQKLFYIFEVVKSMENSRMCSELDYAYYRLGNAYWELEQYDESMRYHRQSLDISHRKGELFIQIGIVRRMAVVLLKQGKAKEALLLLEPVLHTSFPLTEEDKMYLAQSFGACYSALKQYQLAEKYYLESIAWSKQPSLQFQYTAWRGISQFYVANGQYTKAAPFLKLLLMATDEQIIPNQKMDVHLMCFKVDSAQGNYLGAIRHYQLYKALNDSIFNERKSQQISQLSIQYETDKKEQDLKLKEKDITLLVAQAKSQQVLHRALVIGTVLLLVILIIGYSRYRLKQRSNCQLRQQQQLLQAQQKEIGHKNAYLSELLTEKDLLLVQKDTLLGEKDQLLQEKEWLLKEIHHRVKNNLQIVMSLLNTQAASLQDRSALSAIQESGQRVQAMSLIHQKLYQSGNVTRISMQSYIEELVAFLRDSYLLQQLIRFDLSIEPIELDVTTAVPMGLIVNEAVTNAFKYAFPGDRSGTIKLRLHQLTGMSYRLSISDDGVGFPDGYSPCQGNSLGMTLIHGFSEQLGGTLTISGSEGVSIDLVFAEEHYNFVHSPALQVC